MESEVFGKEIQALETAAELKSAFENHGIEINEEEVVEICHGIVTKSSDVLSEEDLEIVSGGSFLAGLAIIAGGWAVSYAVGYVTGKILKKKTGACY